MNSIIKNFSKVLALTLTFNANISPSSSKTIDNIKEKNIQVVDTIKSKGKKFFKKHPVISKTGIVIASLYGTYKVIYEAGKIWCLKDITTAIDHLSNAEVKRDIHKQIEVYQNRAVDIFKIEDSVIKKAHPRTLLLTLMRLNYLFDKYNNFTKALIDYKKQQGTEFTLRLLSYKNDGVISLSEERTEVDLGGFAFGNLSNYRDNLYKYKRKHKIRYFAPCDNDKLIEYIITHEFGHAIEFLYMAKQLNINWKNTGTIRGLGLTDITKKSISDQQFSKALEQLILKSNNIKDNILNKAEKYHNSNNEISKYGTSAPTEFFAEAFAHMECSSEVNPIGLATKDVISEWFND